MDIDRAVLEKAASLLEAEYGLPIHEELRAILENEEAAGPPRDWSVVLSTMTGGVMAQVLFQVGRNFFAILRSLDAQNLTPAETVKIASKRLHEEMVVPAKQFGATVHAIIAAVIKAYLKRD